MAAAGLSLSFAARGRWRPQRPGAPPPPCSSPAAAGTLASGASGDARGRGWRRWSAGGRVRVAAWVALAAPPCPSSLLSGGGEVNGIDDESTATMSGSGGVVAGVRVVGSTAG
jgi:hypothetical protein